MADLHFDIDTLKNTIDSFNKKVGLKLLQTECLNGQKILKTENY
ncbi:hypothetical protein HMPREF9713_00909 [Myroides odoratimimus CCUG 12700]|nr:hypothetical protein HMPREF9713_00909 [Myroides odoratimimus CCUG 12700]